MKNKTNNNKIAVISLSGGMDSTGLLIHLLDKGYEVFGISFYYGQKHSLELDRLQNNVVYLRENGYNINHEIVDLSSVMGMFNSSLTDPNIKVPEGFYAEENMKSTVVPNRNAIFSSIVYGYALSIANKRKQNVDICMGVHSGDHAIYPDCTPKFFDKIYDAFAAGNWDSDRVSLYLPYIESDKEGILRDLLVTSNNLSLDFDTILSNTNTSYSPDEQGRANGYTGSDVERILAFHAIDRVDPVEYVDSWEVVLNNAIKSEKEFNESQLA